MLLSGFRGGSYQYSNGAAVFFPWSWEGYLVSRENYESVWFTKDRKNSNFDVKWKGWADFLKKYLSEVTYRKAEPLTPDAPFGTKYRYRSGVIFDETSESMPLSGGETPLTKLGTSQTSKLGSSQTSKMGGGGRGCVLREIETLEEYGEPVRHFRLYEKTGGNRALRG